MRMPPQFETVVAIGAMKSFTAAVNESDERLFRYAPLKPAAVAGREDAGVGEVDRRLAERPRGQRPARSAIGSVTAAVLIARLEVAGERLGLAPARDGVVRLADLRGVAVVTQRWRPRIGLVPPCERSYLISTSPAVRTGVTPLAAHAGRLVELEVHVRRAARLLDPLPREVQEVLSLDVLVRDVEPGQVALVVRDRAVDHRRTACPPWCRCRRSRSPSRRRRWPSPPASRAGRPAATPSAPAARVRVLPY